MQSRYQDHLDRVSRSFAFCIQQLPQPEKDWVGLSYLLCRLVDTVEDHQWESFEEQSLGFERFISFVRERPNSLEHQFWVQSFPKTLNVGERELVEASLVLLEDFHELPENVKPIIERAVLSMSRGMMAFQENHGADRTFRIQSLTQLDQYCFFVAGLVGELLTKLMAESRPIFKPGPATFRQSIHFGLFLQKINILKDWTLDSKEGRVFIENPACLLPSVARHACEAMAYIESIPQSLRAYRRFCAWSFFIGMASIPYSVKSWTQGQPIKLPKVKALLLTEKVARWVESDSKLRGLFDELSQNLSQSLPKPPQDKASTKAKNLVSLGRARLSELYQGELAYEDLCSVGLIAR